MPIMQQAQDIYGYLPIEVQTMISDETGDPVRKDLRRFHILCPVRTCSPRASIRFLSVSALPAT